MPTSSAHEQAADLGPALEYARRVHAEALDWYRTADAKAQLIVTLSGAFVTILAGAVFSDPGSVAQRVGVFGPETWILLAATGLGVGMAIGCAIVALHSRLGDSEPDTGRSSDCSPGVSWWFGHVARLERVAYMQRIASITDQSYELAAMTSQSVRLSQHVREKHRWVNRGWLCVAGALIALIGTVASFLARI